MWIFTLYFESFFGLINCDKIAVPVRGIAGQFCAGGSRNAWGSTGCIDADCGVGCFCPLPPTLTKAAPRVAISIAPCYATGTCTIKGNTCF